MTQAGTTSERALSPRWRAKELLAWLGLMAIWTAAWSWGSVLVAEHFSPAVVFPILSGIVFGLGCLVAMRLTGLASRRWLIGGTLVFAAALVVGHHYVGYRLARLALQQRHSGVDVFAAFPDMEPTFVRFLKSEAVQGRPWFWLTLRGPWTWASWGLDGLLEAIAAAVVVGIASRQPYCSQCRTWYRTVRSGAVDARTATALAEICGGPMPSGGIEYQIAQCQAGCGPARLDLIASRSGEREARAWLDREQAARVRAILDATPPHAAADPEDAATTGGSS